MDTGRFLKYICFSLFIRGIDEISKCHWKYTHHVLFLRIEKVPGNLRVKDITITYIYLIHENVTNTRRRKKRVIKSIRTNKLCKDENKNRAMCAKVEIGLQDSTQHSDEKSQIK